MAATAQAPQRKQFRLSRYKADEFVKAMPQPKVKPTHPAMRPDGGSKQTLPFDPLELSRRLEIHQQELKLARARREIADLNERHRKAKEAISQQDRNDSGHDSGEKTETASIEELAEVEEENAEEELEAVEDVFTKETDQEADFEQLPELQKPASIRRSRPRPRSRPSSSRARRNPNGAYFPRFAAQQFTATTTPLPTTAPSKRTESSSFKAQGSLDTTDVPKPKQTFEGIGSGVPKRKPVFADGLTPKQTCASGTSMPKPMERSGASAPDLDPIRDRRRSVMLFSDVGGPSSAKNAHNATTRPRPLSTALENLAFVDGEDDNAERNPYFLSAKKPDVADADNHCSAKEQGSRPPLRYHDHQNDWSQASQRGDSSRSSLHLHHIWRKDSVGKKGDVKQSGKNQGDAPDNQTMVADAVKLVKDERRKSSLLSFFKRHH